ncbi:hypothetical protein B0I21_10496 [Sphingobacterium paludis]|uniref:Uncharacterized protein n=1 Tax=Sphingobacterium paludis TaxID=1476465 RepID=A0A4R7CZG7_9SPHI|nr:hypothetical protein B0I21_10496 [Sphingobacterium paludis]
MYAIQIKKFPKQSTVYILIRGTVVFLIQTSVLLDKRNGTKTIIQIDFYKIYKKSQMT